MKGNIRIRGCQSREESEKIKEFLSDDEFKSNKPNMELLLFYKVFKYFRI